MIPNCFKSAEIFFKDMLHTRFQLTVDQLKGYICAPRLSDMFICGRSSFLLHFLRGLSFLRTCCTLRQVSAETPQKSPCWSVLSEVFLPVIKSPKTVFCYVRTQRWLIFGIRGFCDRVTHRKVLSGSEKGLTQGLVGKCVQRLKTQLTI